MKNTIAIMMAASMTAVMFTGCGEKPDSKQTEINVFAAASMTETLTEVGEKYMADNPEVSLVFTFGSSGDLQSQIEEGAEADLFISAGKKQMEALDEEYVLTGSRRDLLENKVVLSVPDENKAGINSFDDLVAALSDGNILFAMGNADVPVGQYTQRILEYYSLDEETLANAGVITYGNDVKEVTSQVSEASVDAGVIYSTDAFSAGLKVVDEATPEMCGQVIYPAAVMNVTDSEEEALKFLEYLSSDEAVDVFESVGFSVLK